MHQAMMAKIRRLTLALRSGHGLGVVAASMHMLLVPSLQFHLVELSTAATV
jgi:hypothetical protein